MSRRVAAELIGTFVLVFFAVGSAVVGIDRIGPVGVALAFGFVLLALAYAVGPISGCHVNPAVTLDVLLTRRMTSAEASAYVVAQVVGAVLAGGMLKLLVTVGGVTDQTGGLGTNSWGESVNPARSIGPAVFAGVEALSQLWLFILAPLVGALLAVGVLRVLAAGPAVVAGSTAEPDPTGASAVTNQPA